MSAFYCPGPAAPTEEQHKLIYGGFRQKAPDGHWYVTEGFKKRSLLNESHWRAIEQWVSEEDTLTYDGAEQIIHRLADDPEGGAQGILDEITEASVTDHHAAFLCEELSDDVPADLSGITFADATGEDIPF